jgi:hypothetical protein
MLLLNLLIVSYLVLELLENFDLFLECLFLLISFFNNLSSVQQLSFIFNLNLSSLILFNVNILFELSNISIELFNHLLLLFTRCIKLFLKKIDLVLSVWLIVWVLVSLVKCVYHRCMLSLRLFKLLFKIFELHVQELNLLVSHCNLFLSVIACLLILLVDIFEFLFKVIDCLFLNVKVLLGLL